MSLFKPTDKKLKQDPHVTLNSRETPQFPNDYDTPGLAHRRYVWVSRLLGLVSISSLILNVVLVFALVSLLPLKEVRPFLVQLAEDKNVVANIQPIDRNITSMEALTQANILQYVRFRHEIVRSNTVMTQRWGNPGQLSLMTDELEYRRFVREVSAAFDEIRKSDFTQEVDVTNINVIKAWSIGNPGTYQVNFKLVGRGPSGNVITERFWTATLEDRKSVV